MHGQAGNCFTVRQVNYTKMLQEKIILSKMLTTRPFTPYRSLATTELYDHTHTAHMQNLSLSKIGISFSAIILLRGTLMHTPQHTVEPPNRGHFGTAAFVLSSEVVLFSEVV